VDLIDVYSSQVIPKCCCYYTFANQGDKKAVVGSDAIDPFKELETTVRNEITNWTINVFKVNREVYDGDEALCKVLEHAIWVRTDVFLLDHSFLCSNGLPSSCLLSIHFQYEADKMLLSIDNIKSTLQSQVTWLTGAEKEMILIITDSLLQRYYRELNSINQVIDYVSKQILNANPLEPLLLVSPDSKPISKENALKELYQEVSSSKAFIQLKKKTPAMHNASASVVSRPSTGEGRRSRPASRPQSAINFNRPLSSTGMLIMKAASEAQGKAPSRTSSGRRLEAPAVSSNTSSANNPSYVYNNSTSAYTDANNNLAIPNDDSFIDDLSEAALGNGKQQLTDSSNGSPKKASLINNIGSKRSSNASDITTSRGTIYSGDKSKRKQSVVSHKDHTVSMEEMARRKAHAIYVAKRTAFMASLDTRRNEREKEFKRMGMNAAVAKLAAFNDLHLQDDQDLEDFDMIHKPKTKKKMTK